jgi:hypothetical protein
MNWVGFVRIDVNLCTISFTSQVHKLLPGFILIRCNLLAAVHPKQQILHPDNDGLAQIDEIGRQDQFVTKDEHKTHTVYSSAFALISPIYGHRVEQAIQTQKQ